MESRAIGLNGRAEALRLREQATQLLERLLVDRNQLELDLHERGRVDKLKTVTGASALDRSIQSTRRMVETIDRYLDEGAVVTRPPTLRRFTDSVGRTLAVPAGIR